MKNITSDMLLPDFEVFTKDGNTLVKHPPCNEFAEPLNDSITSSSHALVPMGQGPIKVKLPEHRIFLKLNKKGGDITFEEVKGTVNVPDCSSWWNLVSLYMTPGSIIEVDVRYFKESDKYATEGDIDRKYVPNGNYFYAAQLCVYRGSTLCTVGYFEKPSNDQDTSIQPILRKIDNLPPLWQQMEQECQRIYRERVDNGITIHPGITALKFASTVDNYTKHLVQYSGAGNVWKHKKPYSKGAKHGNKQGSQAVS